MSTAAKWLLIVLLALMIHALFMTSIAVGSGMGGETDIFPFHHVDAVDIGRIVAIEMLLQQFPLSKCLSASRVSNATIQAFTRA